MKTIYEVRQTARMEYKNIGDLCGRFTDKDEAAKLAKFAKAYYTAKGYSINDKTIQIYTVTVYDTCEEAIAGADIPNAILCGFSFIDGFTIMDDLPVYDPNIKPVVNIFTPKENTTIRDVKIVFTAPVLSMDCDNINNTMRKVGEYIIHLFSRQLGKPLYQFMAARKEEIAKLAESNPNLVRPSDVDATIEMSDEMMGKLKEYVNKLNEVEK